MGVSSDYTAHSGDWCDLYDYIGISKMSRLTPEQKLTICQTSGPRRLVPGHGVVTWCEYYNPGAQPMRPFLKPTCNHCGCWLTEKVKAEDQRWLPLPEHMKHCPLNPPRW